MLRKAFFGQLHTVFRRSYVTNSDGVNGWEKKILKKKTSNKVNENCEENSESTSQKSGAHEETVTTFTQKLGFSRNGFESEPVVLKPSLHAKHCITQPAEHGSVIKG